MTFPAKLTELLERATKGPFYLLEQPWLDSGMKTALLAKSPDPHVAKFVCDFEFWADEDGDSEPDNSWSDAEFICFLVNHAEAIRDLVVAADKMKAMNGSCQRAMEQSGMNEALAKLNGENG